MTHKQISGECSSCESSYEVAFVEQLVSQELPEHCPFCGEIIEDLTESYIEDEDELDDEQWD